MEKEFNSLREYNMLKKCTEQWVNNTILDQVLHKREVQLREKIDMFESLAFQTSDATLLLKNNFIYVNGIELMYPPSLKYSNVLSVECFGNGMQWMQDASKTILLFITSDIDFTFDFWDDFKEAFIVRAIHDETEIRINDIYNWISDKYKEVLKNMKI